MTDHPELPTTTLYAIKGDKPLGTIGIPVRDHLNAATATALLTTALKGGFGNAGETVDFNIVQGSILPTQRNELIRQMRGDWLMYIDDDMIWQPTQIADLIAARDENDLDMLGALCYRRSAPHQPTLFMREGPLSGGYNFLEKWNDNEITEVDATGMAFIVIHRRVFERMVGFYENKPGWVLPPYEKRIQEPPPNFFRWEGQFGEDLRFCQEAKAAGNRIWVHTGIEIGHMAEVSIGRDNFLIELAKRTPEMIETRRNVNDKMGLPTVDASEARRLLGW